MRCSQITPSAKVHVRRLAFERAPDRTDVHAIHRRQIHWVGVGGDHVRERQSAAGADQRSAQLEGALARRTEVHRAQRPRRQAPEVFGDRENRYQPNAQDLQRHLVAKNLLEHTVSAQPHHDQGCIDRFRARRDGCSRGSRRHLHRPIRNADPVELIRHLAQKSDSALLVHGRTRRELHFGAHHRERRVHREHEDLLPRH
ncbi:MAG: hypothetical protein WD801_00800 [Gemmatimonadaceae bacterium]